MILLSTASGCVFDMWRIRNHKGLLFDSNTKSPLQGLGRTLSCAVLRRAKSPSRRMTVLHWRGTRYLRGCEAFFPFLGFGRLLLTGLWRAPWPVPGLLPWEVTTRCCLGWLCSWCGAISGLDALASWLSPLFRFWGPGSSWEIFWHRLYQTCP